MHEVALDLLILLSGVWLVAVTLRPLGLPTITGELIVGVLVGPAVLGLIEPSEAISLLADIGIFFLMFHAAVETQPVEFLDALRRSLGVAVVGAIVPFGISFLVASAFGLGPVAATFVGLTMTATAVVVTLKSLKDLGLANTRVARVIVASCVIDDLLTLVFFGLIVGMLSGGSFEPMSLLVTLLKVAAFFGVGGLLGRFVYPRLTLPFRSPGGKGFTFILLVAIASGLFAELIGLHMILGAYLAGLFFEEKVAHPNLVKVVADRSYGIAYSFLGPIFFMSLGFSITFDISGIGLAFLLVLTVGVIVGQILSAGGMALRLGLPPREALTVGVGMCGRAELAFILAALALTQGAIDQSVFSVLIFTAFILNLFTPLALKGCAVLLQGRAARVEGATRGVVQTSKFESVPFLDGGPRKTLPNVDDGVVVYGYGPVVDLLIAEVERRSMPLVVIEEDQAAAQKLYDAGHVVVHASLADHELDLGRLATARALVANREDDRNALFALTAREAGFGGPIVAMVASPHRRASMTLAGATVTFTPSHVLAAVLAARASSKIAPPVAALGPLSRLVEVAELRVHDSSPLAHKTLAEVGVHARTGANIVGRWSGRGVAGPPSPHHVLEPGTILVAVGSPSSVRQLGELIRPSAFRTGPIVVIGFGDVGRELTGILRDAGEDVCVVARTHAPGVDIVGNVVDLGVVERTPVKDAGIVILALESDSATVFAATVVRNHAPEVPMIAGLDSIENVPSAHRAGVDFATSLSQVGGQLLVHHALGQTLALRSRVRLVRFAAGPLAGRDPFAAGIRERTGCTVVAVERQGEVILEFEEPFTLEEDDGLFVCGTAEAIAAFEAGYLGARV